MKLFFSYRRNFASLSGAFGADFFHGPKTIERRFRLVELPKDPTQHKPLYKVQYVKFPKELTQIGDKCVFKPNKLTSPLAHYKRYYYLDHPDNQHCVVGSTKKEIIVDRPIMIELAKRTSGFVIQLEVSGDSSKAFFDPEWPKLMYKGKGILVNLTNACIRASPECKVFLNSNGTLITIHGYILKKVQLLARVIHRHGKYSAHTSSGIQYSQLPIKNKTIKRAKKLDK